MITRLTGTLEAIEDGIAIVAVSEVGLAYEVLLPAYMVEPLEARVGQTITLQTRHHLESLNQGASFIPRLIGFVSTADRRFFELFTTVKGLGARKALRALAEEPGVIARHIAARDARSLQKLPEIGKRLAETIIAELSDRVAPYLADDLDRAEPKPRKRVITPPAEEAIEALIALGESRVDAERKVERALSRNGELTSAEAILASAFAS
jgi:Holliday junction DNA helicase RuvA